MLFCIFFYCIFRVSRGVHLSSLLYLQMPYFCDLFKPCLVYVGWCRVWTQDCCSIAQALYPLGKISCTHWGSFFFFGGGGGGGVLLDLPSSLIAPSAVRRVRSWVAGPGFEPGNVIEPSDAQPTLPHLIPFSYTGFLCCWLFSFFVPTSVDMWDGGV